MFDWGFVHGLGDGICSVELKAWSFSRGLGSWLNQDFKISRSGFEVCGFRELRSYVDIAVQVSALALHEDFCF